MILHEKNSNSLLFGAQIKPLMLYLTIKFQLQRHTTNDRLIMRHRSTAIIITISNYGIKPIKVR